MGKTGNKPMKKCKIKFWQVFTLLLLLLAVLLADSAGRVVVSEYIVSSPLLSEAFDGFRIVQLSDVHGAEFGEGNGVLLEKVKEAAPDLIALTGDLIDKDTEMAAVNRLLEGLTAIAPVYFVSGNHEWGDGDFDALRTLLDKHSVTYLQNEHLLLERGEASIVLAGVEDPNGWKDMPTPEETVDIILEEQGECFTVLLGHRNYWVEEYPDLMVDLILCGHAHGGIIRLPFVGGVIGTGRELFPDYVDGAFESGRYTMIVSRGLGSAPIPRFLNNPEIVSVTLQSE